MGGFQRIPDTSELSIRVLNDQLEGLWRKVLGNVGIEDLSDALKKQLSDGKGEEVDPPPQKAQPKQSVLPIIAGRAWSDTQPVRVYVSPEGDDCNDGVSRECAFKTIKRAWASIPYHCTDHAIIYLSPGEYYEYVELEGPFTGKLEIQGNNATLHGVIDIKKCAGNIHIDSLNIAAIERHAVRVDMPGGTLMLMVCNIDSCNLTGSSGVYVTAGGANIVYCNLFNCRGSVFYAEQLSRLHINYCAGGSNSNYGITAANGAIVTGIGSTAKSSRGNREQEGGKILDTLSASETSVQNYGKGCNVISFEAEKTAGALGGVLVDDIPKQGKSESDSQLGGGYWFFDKERISLQLSNKKVVAAELVLMRSNAIGEEKRVEIELYEHNMANTTQEIKHGQKLGKLSSVMPGEKVYIPLPKQSVERMIQKECRGYCVYSEEMGFENYIEFLSNENFRAKLNIIYI